MKIIVFGLGKKGKRYISIVKRKLQEIEIAAICDNNAEIEKYEGIPVIRVADFLNIRFDEIHICTVYYKHIIEQLKECGYSADVCRVIDDPITMYLDCEIRKKYKDELSGKKSVENKEIAEVLDYIKDNRVRMYNYNFVDKYRKQGYVLNWDDKAGLFYGIYGGKRLYLSKRYCTRELAEEYYERLICEQDIESPHCYNVQQFKNETYVCVDVGAAEGIYALGLVEVVKHIYLIESEPEWIEALEHTFEAYKDKVTIINKLVDEKDSDETIKLDTLLKGRIDLIKMDIEGYELSALKGAHNILKEFRPILQICTYHHPYDYEQVCKFLANYQYNVETSKGLILCTGEWELDETDIDFRKGLVTASN